MVFKKNMLIPYNKKHVISKYIKKTSILNTQNNHLIRFIQKIEILTKTKSPSQLIKLIYDGLLNILILALLF
ncbi:hypothetical protein HYN56_19485 [Flavobacterium crocinum]|uniref:Uncharacterized protein n=1 Tax=Flavobacterium crocinum TaxID=2183896 RepID=A0A2S1YR82_9FLAO|nr:hypothetical protein HYN56_19485 [Flavobacterium crocinum]